MKIKLTEIWEYEEHFLGLWMSLF